MNKTLLLTLCILGLTSCQSGKPKEQALADPASSIASIATVQSVPAEAHGATPASAIAAQTPQLVKEVVTPVAIPVVVKPKSQPVLSDAEAIALAKKRGCYGCHTVHAKVYGPAWKDVAAKYRGDANAQTRLADKVAKGGGGVWGSLAMPAQTQASEAERTQLVRFILNLK